MPISKTKNYKSEEQIAKMAGKAFGNVTIEEMIELTEGYFNVAYGIKLSNDKEVILKIAPTSESIVMTFEKNIMLSEVESMRKVASITNVPVPEILFFDDSGMLCESSYFFMEKLEGKSFSSCSDKLTQKQRDSVFWQVGKYTAMINGITGDRFGYFGQPDKQGSNWYEVFRSMLMDTFNDAERKNIEIKVDRSRILELLDKDKFIFEKVSKPRLVHWDIWAGNVFIKHSTVIGIIDFERCLWADELMEVGFRTYGYEKAFFEGYGMEGLDQEQTIRAKWYDIYLFLLSSLECDYRGYDNRDAYNWGNDMLIKWIHGMESLIS